MEFEMLKGKQQLLIKRTVDGLHSEAVINTESKETDRQRKAIVDFNMESTMTPDNVEEAGGIGATDDMSSLLPVALDSTDSEASLRNACNYEEEQGEVDELQSKAVINTESKETESQGKAIVDFNMESTMTPDDVERAGGFGATDDMSSLLPVALDSTDFEASLRNARDYEDEQGEVSRPGLGWSGKCDTV